MPLTTTRVVNLLNNAGNAFLGAVEVGKAVIMDTTPFLPRASAIFVVDGTFVGTVKLQKSDDDGVTWTDVVIDPDGSTATTSVPIRAEVKLGGQMRANATAYTSGKIQTYLEMSA